MTASAPSSSSEGSSPPTAVLVARERCRAQARAPRRASVAFEGEGKVARRRSDRIVAPHARARTRTHAHARARTRTHAHARAPATRGSAVNRHLMALTVAARFQAPSGRRSVLYNCISYNLRNTCGCRIIMLLGLDVRARQPSDWCRRHRGSSQLVFQAPPHKAFQLERLGQLCGLAGNL